MRSGLLPGALAFFATALCGHAATTTNSVGMAMVDIPAGQFQMGQAERETSYRTPWSAAKDTGADFDEQPVHAVQISQGFAMSATPVTNAEYEQFDPAHKAKRPKKNISGEDDAAVINVDWDDANAFCQWLATKESKPYRLPTEAEYEYACRAGTTSLFFTGDTLPAGYQQIEPPLLEGFAAYFPVAAQIPPYYKIVKDVSLRVGQQPANGWGLFDMAGLVNEWCLDWYGPYDPSTTRDPVGPAAGDFRVIRGGAHSQFARLLRSANRSAMEPWARNERIGFRVVQAPPVMTAPTPPVLVPDTVEQPAAADAPPEKLDPRTPLFEGPNVFTTIPPNSEGPLFSKHNHDPGITVCPNGDVLAIWYTTDEETGNELNVACSRWIAGATAWSPATLFWACADANNHAPAIFTDTDGTIYHFNGNKMLPGAVFRVSHDNGYTWTRAQPYCASTVAQPGESTIRTSDGRILGTLDGKFSTGLVNASSDNGKTWTELTNDDALPNLAPGATGTVIAGIHVGLIERKDGSLWAIGRFDKPAQSDKFQNKCPVSISTDGGKTWTYSMSDFPEIRTGQRPTLKRLHGGPLLLCSFTDDGGRRGPTGELLGAKPFAEMSGMPVTGPDGKTVTGYGLFAALSFDDGATWPVRKLVTPIAPGQSPFPTTPGEGGAFLLDATHAETHGYLASCEGVDGRIHLISSRQHYVFNYAWLTQGTSYAPK